VPSEQPGGHVQVIRFLNKLPKSPVIKFISITDYLKNKINRKKYSIPTFLKENFFNLIIYFPYYFLDFRDG